MEARGGETRQQMGKRKVAQGRKKRKLPRKGKGGEAKKELIPLTLVSPTLGADDTILQTRRFELFT